jgi:hypothetical protein
VKFFSRLWKNDDEVVALGPLFAELGDALETKISKTTKGTTKLIETFKSGQERFTYFYSKGKRFKWSCCLYQGQMHPLYCYKPKVKKQ